MIDTHCHLLPGVDDGAESLEDALTVGAQLYNAGFRTILVTPHVMEGRDYLTPDKILEATEQLQDCFTENNISLNVLPGAENYMFPEMAHWLSEGKLMTLGNKGRYLLLEFPMMDIPYYVEQVIFELQVAGMIPVLAHPERYKPLAENRERLMDWYKRGILFQLDLRSLSGRFGPLAEQFAVAMVKGRLVHFIGSDAHRVSKREKAFGQELEILRRLTEPSYFERITVQNPQQILEGGSIEPQGDDEFNFVYEKLNGRKKKRDLRPWIQKLLR